ncbi:MAG: PDC sensor domain-containing protein [Campylobacterales bacterium]|nr:PDC sensor domain-containing protein [Campylobacterales bacterium]
MLSEIRQFSTIRVEARAFLTFLLTRNIPNHMPDITLDTIIAAFKKIKKENDAITILYVLDAKGVQLTDNISAKPEFRKGSGANRAMRAYYYRAAREKKPILTDPYPSVITGDLCVSASMPIYDDKNNLKFVAVLDIPLSDILKIIRPTAVDSLFQNTSKITYGVFSLALFFVAALLFVKGITGLFAEGLHPDAVQIQGIFETTILFTLSLAIFDLVKAIFEEEVLGRNKRESISETHQTMTRFIGSIIIAVAIEALMLVFKFALTDPSKMTYALILLGGVAALLVSLAYYIKSTKRSKRENIGN